MRCVFLAAIAAFTMFVLSPADAQQSEHLRLAVPKGFKAGTEEKKSSAMLVREMLREGETLQTWTEMVTSMTFPKMGDVAPAQYRARMQTIWDSYCPGSEYVTLKDETQNGYATLTWLWKCPRNPQTGKPELSWMKAIQGRDNLYSIQRALRFEPSEAQKEELARYFDSVRVCDPRLPDRPCT